MESVGPTVKGALAFLRRLTHDIPSPAEWMLEVTNRCDLACPMCLRDKVDFVTQDMDPHLIRDLLNGSAPPNAIWPYGFGEPLLYPHLFEAVRQMKKKGVIVSLSTSGTQLDHSTGAEMIESGLDYLIVAFDGATPRTYEKYRRGASFYQVKDNVERFLALKAFARSQIHITLQMILLNGTQNEVSAFKRLWTRTGVDQVRLREDLLKRPKTAAPTKNCSGHRPCFFLWRGPLFVQAAGTVIPCPYYHGSEPFGDLKTQSINEAWNSPKMTELRQAHVSGDLSKFPVCRACPRYQPHTALAAASFFITTTEIRRYLPVVERIQQRLGKTFFE